MTILCSLVKEMRATITMLSSSTAACEALLQRKALHRKGWRLCVVLQRSGSVVARHAVADLSQNFREFTRKLVCAQCAFATNALVTVAQAWLR